MIKRYVQAFSVRPVWDIEGYPNYFFGDDEQLYRITSRGEIRRNILKSKFFSLGQLRPMLRQHVPPTDHPTAT
jgi:hypothetical protein